MEDRGASLEAPHFSVWQVEEVEANRETRIVGGFFLTRLRSVSKPPPPAFSNIAFHPKRGAKLTKARRRMDRPG